MARLPRFCPAGLPQHVIQRGHNRQVCFGSEEDFAAYAHWLGEYTQQFEVSVHAWVFMTNHVHLLVTPHSQDGVSKFMQALGRRYVQYFNRAYKRSGTLWEGRFKSSIVQSEHYLLQCYRYIELNPVRANMVNDPADYAWSSYRVNALGVESALCTPHAEFLALGRDAEQRREAYRALFRAHVDARLLTDIRQALNTSMALGNERFKESLEDLYARRVRPASAGRPSRDGKVKRRHGK
jgi:putative transposase